MAPKIVRYALIWWYRAKQNHIILLSELPKKYQHAPVVCSLHGEEIKVVEISEDMSYLHNRMTHYQIEQQHARNTQHTSNSSTASKEGDQGVNSLGSTGGNISQKFQSLMGKAAKRQKSLEIGSAKSIITNKKIRKANHSETVKAPDTQNPNLDESSPLQERSLQNDMLPNSTTNNPLPTTQSNDQQPNNEIPQINEYSQVFHDQHEAMLPPSDPNTISCFAMPESHQTSFTSNHSNREISQPNIVHDQHETMLPLFVQNTNTCITMPEINHSSFTPNYVNNDISRANIVHTDQEIPTTSSYNILDLSNSCNSKVTYPRERSQTTGLDSSEVTYPPERSQTTGLDSSQVTYAPERSQTTGLDSSQVTYAPERSQTTLLDSSQVTYAPERSQTTGLDSSEVIHPHDTSKSTEIRHTHTPSNIQQSIVNQSNEEGLSSSTDTSDNEEAGLSNEIVSSMPVKRVTLDVVKIMKYNYKAYKQRYYAERKLVQEAPNPKFKVPNDYLRPSENQKEIYPNCGFFIPESVMHLIQLSYRERNDWKVFVKDILIYVYGNHIIHFSATGRKNGINSKLFNGLREWLTDTQPTLSKSDLINYINSVIVNKRNYLNKKKSKKAL